MTRSAVDAVFTCSDISRCFQFCQLALKQFCVDTMPHDEVAIEVDNRNVIAIFLKPFAVLRCGDVNFFQKELQPKREHRLK